jgi:broad specificity phosphatase PhoE
MYDDVLLEAGGRMKTILYLLRHGATKANLAHPARLQGQRLDLPLARTGIRQAELTRDLLAVRPLAQCYCSPLRRAVQTAAILAAPHGLTPRPLDALLECDVGRWEGLSWEEIRAQDQAAYERFWADPAAWGYPGGESFADVHRRVSACLEELFARHGGQSFLVVSHHIANRTYLAGLLGLPPGQARKVSLDNCGISVVTQEDGEARLITLNATFHLDGVAAA